MYWKDNSNNEEGFTVYKISDDYSINKTYNLPKDSNSYTDYEVVSGINYSYKISSFNHNGLSSIVGPAFGRIITSSVTPPIVSINSTCNEEALYGTWDMPVLVVRYFPLLPGEDPSNPDALIDGLKIKDDPNIEVFTGGGKLGDFRNKLEEIENNLAVFLTEASKYHGYRISNAEPSLTYHIVEVIEHFEEVPYKEVYDDPEEHEGKRALIDNRELLFRENICDWVDNKGIKEVWIWANWDSIGGHFESGMSTPQKICHANGPCNGELPVCENTYVVYEYNPTSHLGNAFHDHMHQIEVQNLRTDEVLFHSLEGPFGQKDFSGNLVQPQGCGWAHYAPNSIYDGNLEGNTNPVSSYCENWNPNGNSQAKSVSCQTWTKCSGGCGCDDVINNDITGFYVWNLQNMPGKDNNLNYQGKKLTNWWIFTGDWDAAVSNKVGLTCSPA